MIISHRLKMAFFRPPKTGSTTAGLLLRKGLQVCAEDWHTPMPRFSIEGTVGMERFGHDTPTHAVDEGLITLEQLREYDCYATLREPIERRVSACGHASRHFARSGTPRYDLHECRHLGRLGQSQEDWFKYKGELVLQPIWFDDLENEIARVVLKHGGTPVEPQNVNPGVFPKTDDLYDIYGRDAHKVALELLPEIEFYNTMLSRR